MPRLCHTKGDKNGTRSSLADACNKRVVPGRYKKAGAWVSVIFMSHLKLFFYIPYHESQTGQVEKVQRTAARCTCRRWRNTSCVGDMLDELGWPSLETRREQSSLTFFYKIHSRTVSLDSEKIQRDTILREHYGQLGLRFNQPTKYLTRLKT